MVNITLGLISSLLSVLVLRESQLDLFAGCDEVLDELTSKSIERVLPSEVLSGKGKLFGSEGSLELLDLSLGDGVEGADGCDSEDLDSILDVSRHLLGIWLVSLGALASGIELYSCKFVDKFFKLCQFGTSIILF